LFFEAGSVSKSKFRLKLEPWRAIDAQNEGVEAQKRGLEAQMEAWRLRSRRGGSNKGLEAQIKAWRLK
jgi:hypothetical protein